MGPKKITRHRYLQPFVTLLAGVPITGEATTRTFNFIGKRLTHNKKICFGIIVKIVTIHFISIKIFCENCWTRSRIYSGKKSCCICGNRFLIFFTINKVLKSISSFCHICADSHLAPFDFLKIAIYKLDGTKMSIAIMKLKFGNPFPVLTSGSCQVIIYNRIKILH